MEGDLLCGRVSQSMASIEPSEAKAPSLISSRPEKGSRVSEEEGMGRCRREKEKYVW